MIPGHKRELRDDYCDMIADMFWGILWKLEISDFEIPCESGGQTYYDCEENCPLVSERWLKILKEVEQ